MLILLAGLPASGKSTLARAIASRIPASILNKDRIRSALFSAADIEYSTEQDDFVMKLSLQAAAYILQRRPSHYVLVDGRPFSHRYQLEEAIAVAASIAQPWRIIECVCSEESARQRLSHSAASTHPAANRDYSLYLETKARFEPITFPKTTINTDNPFETSLQQALNAVK